MKTARTRRKTKQPSKLDEREWNFSDSAKVPNEELVACCYWEYGRESKFIRAVAQMLKNVHKRKGCGKSLSAANQDLNQFYSIGTPAKLFESTAFPSKPWQVLDANEKSKWIGFVPKISMWPVTPAIQTGKGVVVLGRLHGEAQNIFGKEQAILKRQADIDTGAGNLNEAAKLERQLAELGQQKVSVLDAGGVETLAMQINWREFGDAEIVSAFKKWVNDARPTDPQTGQLVGKRHPKQGQDADTWRVSLEQLGIMRVRHNYPFDDEMPRPVTATKYTSKSENNRERSKAAKTFHKLFPFLPVTENPLHFQDFLQRK
jgi:hypothetical protein